MTATPSDHDLQAFAAALSERYSALRPLAGGGMAELLVGTETGLERQVVIKRVARRLAGQEARDRFQREIAVLATLQHPNIVPLFHADALDDVPYFVMPLVSGESLRDRLQRGPLSVREAVSILEDVTMALETAHAMGVVHRDIKPANILITGSSAVVADFGIAKALARTPNGRPSSVRTPTDLTIEGMSLGTPRYMAPEQFAGDAEADHRVDLYALGVVAYEMLAGAPPFEANTAAGLARAHLAEPPRPLRTRRAGVPPALESLVERCLAKDPEHRPPSAAAVLRELRSSSLLHETHDRPRAATRSRLQSALGVLRQDLRIAVRALWRTPTVLFASVACLALGIGGTATVFSVVDQALLRPLPFAEPQELVSVFRTTRGNGRDPHSAPNFLDLAEDPSFEGLAAVASTTRLVELGARTEPAPTLRVSGSLFPLLRAQAEHGRLLTPADDASDANLVAVVSYEFWREQLGGSPAVIGTQLRIDGTAHEIVGVLRPQFRVPHAFQLMDGDLWLPMRFSERERGQRTSNYLRAFGRLAPGVSIAQAHSALQTRFEGMVEQHPEMKGYGIVVSSMAEESRSTVRMPLLLLLVAALAVLVIAIINVSSLLLARGIRREHELAVRNALGASRWDLMRPVLAESLLIAGAGCALGLGLAMLAVRSIVGMASLQMPHLVGATIDWRVVAVALGVSVLAALLGALAPLLRALRAQPADALRGGRGGGAHGQQRALAALVVVEGALALALLIASGLVFTGFARLARHDPGFDPAPLLTMRLRVSPSDFVEGRVVPAFLDPALDAVRHVPGVAAAGTISQLPYSEWGWNAWVQYEGRPELPPTERPLVETRNVSVGYLETLGHRLVAGRTLEARDASRAADEPMRVVVNETLAERDFPNQDAIGQRILMGGAPSEIVGVVSDVKNFGPFAPPRAEVFWTFGQRHPTAADFRLVVRVSSGEPDAVAGAVQAALRDVYPRIAISRTMRMSEVISESLGRPRLLFALFGTLASVALLLALAGLFGLLSYTVERQHRELGIRAALGASGRRLLAGVLRGATRILLLSTGIGLAVAWMVTRLLESFLYGVEPRDPVVWGIAATAMLAAGVTAALAPALRAARVQPAVAMRQD